MQTAKPFSTISYNTESFLESKLTELIEQGILDFACFVTHQPEDDESKVHKHVYFRPSGKINTNALKTALEELTKDSKKPLGCITFTSSKFDDWYLYAVHDKAYLAGKGLRRKYTYSFEQIWNSDPDFFREQVNCIDRSKFIGTERVINAVKDGVSFAELIRLGGVPIQLVAQYERVYHLLEGLDTVERAGRESHTPKPVAYRKSAAKPKPFLIDEETGEIIEISKKKKK